MTKDDRSDLKSGLDSLFKTAVDQLDELKDVLVSSSSAGKAKLDATMLKRERDQLLTSLGRQVAGSDDQAAFPSEWQDLIGQVRMVEDQISEQEREYERLVKAAVDGLGAAVPGTAGKRAEGDAAEPAEAKAEPEKNSEEQP